MEHYLEVGLVELRHVADLLVLQILDELFGHRFFAFDAHQVFEEEGAISQVEGIADRILSNNLGLALAELLKRAKSDFFHVLLSFAIGCPDR